MSIGMGVPPAAPRPDDGSKEVGSSGFRGWGTFSYGPPDDAFEQKVLSMKPYPGAIETMATPTIDEASVAPADDYNASVEDSAAITVVALAPLLDELMKLETPAHRAKMDEVIAEVTRTVFQIAKVHFEQAVINPETDNQGIGE